MAIINIDELNKTFAQDDAESSSGGSGKQYLSRKDIPDNGELDVRVLPSGPSLNGSFYLKRTRVWIHNPNTGKKYPYLSPRTFGEECPLLDTFDEIMKGTDDQLKALANNQKTFDVSNDYIMPVLQLEVGQDNNVTIVDDCVKIYDCTWTHIKKVYGFFTGRHYQKGEQFPLGIFDRVVGHNITLSKVVKSDKTNYDATIWPQPLEMPEQYYDSFDIFAESKKWCFSHEYLSGVAANYFFGEPMPDDSLKGIDKPKHDTPKIVSSAPAVVASPKVVESPVAEPAAAAAPKTSGMTLLDKLKNKK